MTVLKLEADSPALSRVKEINDEAFPAWERMPLEAMFSFSSGSEVLGFQDGDNLAGFSMVLLNDETAFVMLLAVDSRFRGRGYGTQALNAILSRYSARQVVLDFEEVTERASNYAQRISRKRFYLRNGFHETGRFTVLSGEKFELVCSREALNEESMQDLLAEIHLRKPEFEDRLF